MKSNLIKKYLVFILGTYILGWGISICEYAHLGVDPMSVLVLGTCQRINVSFGTMNFIISLIQLIVAYLCDKKNVTVASILAMIFTSLGIDSFVFLSLGEINGIMSYLFFVFGLVIYCFGIAVSELPQCGYTSYDGVIFGIKKYINCEYHKIRWVIDLSYLIIGFILGGQVGIGTLLILGCAGKLIEIFLEKLRRMTKCH